MTRVCACNCGASLAGLRADAVYASEACSKRARRAASPDKARTGQPLKEVRGQQEEGGASADYLLLAREQICRTLLATGYFTADDLEPLGIPKEYRRSVHGSATGYFSGEEPFMEEAGRRKSERPERKGAKNTVFRISAKGRRELPGLLKGMAGPVADAKKRLYGQALAGVHANGFSSEEGSNRTLAPVGVDSGEKPSVGVPSSQGAERLAAASCRADAGDSPEPLSLFQQAPSLTDPDQRAA